jgi:hypothetical protein
MTNGEKPILPREFFPPLISRHDNRTHFQKVREHFLKHHRLGHNLILSSEHISSKVQFSNPFLWKELTDGFNVRVIIGYRHYFDWFRSYYFQQHHGGRYLREWPGQGGPIHPPFLEYVENHINAWEANGRNNMGKLSSSTHMTLWMYLRWSTRFQNNDDTVIVLDLNQDGDVFTNFACQSLPTANSLCEHLTTLRETSNTNNGTQTFELRTSSDFHADRIVETASEQGLIPTANITISRISYVKRTEILMKKYNIDLSNPHYFSCIQHELEERLLNASAAFLEILYTSNFQQQKQYAQKNWTTVKSQHDLLFQKAKSKGKFCDINTTAVLLNSDFLQELIIMSNTTQTRNSSRTYVS